MWTNRPRTNCREKRGGRASGPKVQTLASLASCQFIYCSGTRVCPAPATRMPKRVAFCKDPTSAPGTSWAAAETDARPETRTWARRCPPTELRSHGREGRGPGRRDAPGALTPGRLQAGGPARPCSRQSTYCAPCPPRAQSGAATCSTTFRQIGETEVKDPGG